MKRSLTAREWILLAVLAVVALVSAYVTLFYLPTTARREAALQETQLCRTQIESALLRVEEKRRMERELAEIFARDPDPLSLAPYDNLHPVMMELHNILDGTVDYSLSFGSVDAEESIVRRSISLNFTSGSYQGARDVLWQLHNSAYRCMLDSVSISMDQTGEGAVSVNSTIVFFEYR